MADTPEGEDLRRFPGRAFDFVDPDGIQMEFTHYNLG